MASRTISGTTPTYPRDMIRFRQLAVFVTSAATYLSAEYGVTTDAEGDFTISVPVPDTGTVPYLILLPDGTGAAVFLGDGAATTLELLLSGAFANGTTADLSALLQAIIDAHAAIEASTTVLGHVKIDGSTITIDGDGVISSTGGGVTDHGALTGLGDDDHPQYHNNARGDLRYWPLSTDMATQAELDSEASTRASADSTLQTNITNEASTRALADSTHAALTTTAHGGIVASTDPRLTDSRAPTGAAGGVLSGTYPSPSFAVDMATQAELDTHAAAADPHPGYLTTAEGNAAYQPLDSDLTSIAALSTTSFGRALLALADAAALRTAGGLGSLAVLNSVTASLISDASANGRSLITAADYSAMRTLLGLVVGTNVQAFDAELAALAGLTSAADKGIQFTGVGTAATFDLTTAGKALLDDANAGVQRTTLGLGTAAVADTGTGAANVPTITQADARYQPLDSDLTSIAALSTVAYGRSLLELANEASARTTFGLDAGGAGDIWVEKAGDTMIGALAITLAAGNSLVVDTTTLVVDATNNRVGIGTASPSTALHQTATTVLTSGTVGFATIYNYVDPPSNSSVATTNADISVEIPSGNIFNVTGTTIAMLARAIHTGTGTLTTIQGMQAQARNAGAGTITTASGGVFNTNNAGAAGIMTTARGGSFTAQNTNTGSIVVAEAGSFVITNSNASGVITTAYGVRIQSVTNAGTIGTTYGVYVGDITAGTQTNTPHSFYASDVNAYNYFAGNTGIGIIAPLVPLHAVALTTTANAVIEVSRIEARVSTASTGSSAGFGPSLTFFGESSVDTSYRQMADWSVPWATATEASKKARIIGNVWDSVAREWIRGEASGTAAMIGFLGANAVVRQTVSAAAVDAGTTQTLVNDLRTALINLGLAA